MNEDKNGRIDPGSKTGGVGVVGARVHVRRIRKFQPHPGRSRRTRIRPFRGRDSQHPRAPRGPRTYRPAGRRRHLAEQ